MTVTVANYSRYVRLSGTIAEVLNKLASTNIPQGKIVYYSDDNTNAVAVYCMTR